MIQEELSLLGGPAGSIDDVFLYQQNVPNLF